MGSSWSGASASATIHEIGYTLLVLRSRRNIAERLGIARADDCPGGREIRAWLDGSHVAWIECESSNAAKPLEHEMEAAHKPPLTKL